VVGAGGGGGNLNKSVAAGHFVALGCDAPPFLLAGRAGEKEERSGACYPGTLMPLAGRGGEERRRCFLVALVSRSGLCPRVLGVVHAE
jgi:hypothetical protein